MDQESLWPEKIEIATTKTCHWILEVVTAYIFQCLYFLCLFLMCFPVILLLLYFHITIENKPQNGYVSVFLCDQF